ncbi:MAG: Bbp16 family capsid cement protein [Victivallales bacterium]|jgi:hypothetical protein
MRVDKNLEFSDAQAETTIATHHCTNELDLAVAGDAEEELYCVIGVHAAPTSEGSATINIILKTSATVNFGGSPVTLWQSGVLAYDNAKLAAGKKFMFRLPQGLLRYLYIDYVIAGAVLTAGSFDAFLTPTPDNYIGQA